MEGVWRALGARRAASTAVGPALAARYAGAPRAGVSFVARRRPRRRRARPRPAAVTLLSVGRLETEKNPLLLADVLAAARRRAYRLQIVGEGPLEADLRARLRRARRRRPRRAARLRPARRRPARPLPRRGPVPARLLDRGAARRCCSRPSPPARRSWPPTSAASAPVADGRGAADPAGRRAAPRPTRSAACSATPSCASALVADGRRARARAHGRGRAPPPGRVHRERLAPVPASTCGRRRSPAPAGAAR